MKTGELIKQLRLKKGTEISVRTIQRIENGEVDPRAYTLQSIASALEVDFEMLASSDPEQGSSNSMARKWLPVLHLSGLLLLVVPPIIIWIWKRDKVANIDAHAYDVINFQLSMTLYLLPCAMFSVYPFLVILIVYSQVMIIVNTVRVTNERNYNYPLSIRFLKLKVVA